jgi:hypothetical protein
MRVHYIPASLERFVPRKRKKRGGNRLVPAALGGGAHNGSEVEFLFESGETHHLHQGFFVERLRLARFHLVEEVFLEPDLRPMDPFAGCVPSFL